MKTPPVCSCEPGAFIVTAATPITNGPDVEKYTTEGPILSTFSRKTPTNKRDRGFLISRYWHVLSPIPHGCSVSVVRCNCPVEHCVCEVELRLDGPREAWETPEAAEFYLRMATFLAVVDPTNHPEPPEDSVGIPWIDQSTRIAAMAERVEHGYCAKSKADHGCDLKVGGLLTRNRNGSDNLDSGVQAFDDESDDEITQLLNKSVEELRQEFLAKQEARRR